MANRSIYITVRLDVENTNTNDITDDDAAYIVQETNYNFTSVDDFTITNTEICGINE